MHSHAPDMVLATDSAGRSAAFSAEDAATLRLLRQAPQNLDLGATDIAGRGLVWYAAALKRNPILVELLCEEGDLPPRRNESGAANATVPARTPGPKAKKALEAGAQDPRASPFLAAVRQHAGLQCTGLAKVPPEQIAETWDVLAHCGGLERAKKREREREKERKKERKKEEVLVERRVFILRRDLLPN